MPSTRWTKGFKSVPGHISGPSQGIFDSGEDSAIPVVFKRCPASFYGIVFAVIGRIINQTNPEVCRLDELHHAFNELSPVTFERWTIVQINHQFFHARISALMCLPPSLQAIDDKVTRFS